MVKAIYVCHLALVLFSFGYACSASAQEFVKQKHILVVGSNLLERTSSEKKLLEEHLNQISQKRCFNCYKFEIPDAPIGTTSQTISYLSQNIEAKKNTDIVIFDFNARALGAEYFDIQYQRNYLDESDVEQISPESLYIWQRVSRTRKFAHSIFLSSQKNKNPLEGALEIFFQNLDLLQDQIKQTDQAKRIVVLISNPWLRLGDISYHRNLIESYYLRRHFALWIWSFSSVAQFFSRRNFDSQVTKFSFSDPTVFGQYLDVDRPWLLQEKAMKFWASEVVSQVDQYVK